MLRKERSALAFPAGDSLLSSFWFALNSAHLPFSELLLSPKRRLQPTPPLPASPLPGCFTGWPLAAFSLSYHTVSLPSANLDLSPELPELQTINLRDIINPRRVQRSDTPEVPELETVNLRQTSNKENVSQNQNLASAAKYESRDTPEAPELSNNYRFGHRPCLKVASI